jgi:hypothetical protein
MAKGIDFAAIEREAKRTLGGLGWFNAGDLPVSHRTPGGYAAFLGALARDLPSNVASSPDFQAAYRAVTAWSSASDLLATATRLFHDPRIREVAGGEANLRWLYDHPSEAMRHLVDHSTRFPQAYRDGSPLAEALQVASQYNNFDVEHESSGPAPTEAQAQQTSQSESRSVASAEARAQPPSRPPTERAPGPGRQNGANQGGAKRPAPSPQTYEGLISKPSLSKDEWSKLMAIASSRHHEPDEFDDLPDTFFGDTEGTTTNE